MRIADRIRELREIAAAEQVLQAWREQLLLWLVSITLALGLPLAGINAYLEWQAGRWVTAVLYLLAYSWVVLLWLSRRFSWRLSFSLRALTFLLILEAVALVTLRLNGFTGDGRLWLLAVIVLGTLLLGRRGGLAFTLVAAVVYAGMAWLIATGRMSAAPQEMATLSIYPKSWFTTGLTLVSLSVVFTISLGNLFRRMAEALNTADTLRAELGRDRERLEQQTRTLQRRVAQIRTASALQQVVNTILDPDELLNEAVNLIRERFDLYYVGAFLLDERGEYAVLRAGTGEAGRRMLAEGHRLAVGETSMIGWCVMHRKARIALDVGEEAVRFANPHLPLTRSELALPLISRGEVLGALTVQSTQERAFDEEDLLVLQGLADTLATALQNARLFQATQDALEEARALHRQYLAEAWRAVPLEQLEAEDVASAVQGDGEEVHRLRVPLEVRGQTLGEVVLESAQPWDEHRRALAEAIAAQTALSLENARLVEESLHRARAERLVGEFTAQVRQTLDMDQLLQVAARELRRALDLSQVEVRLTLESPTLE